MLQWILDFFTEYVNTPMYERTLGQDAWFIVLIGLIAIILVTVGTVGAVLIYKLIQWVKGK
ncbi:MAG: hypothetical protein IKU29_00555 [Parabacteroides sp.]|nr:hypothetical protein [Parabacteroides sp.]